jgi:hypothetical protein
MPIRRASAIPMRRSQRFSCLAGEVALPEFLVSSSFIVVAWSTFSCDELEVHLSMAQENSQGIEDTQRSKGIVA